MEAGGREEFLGGRQMQKKPGQPVLQQQTPIHVQSPSCWQNGNYRVQPEKAWLERNAGVLQLLGCLPRHNHKKPVLQLRPWLLSSRSVRSHAGQGNQATDHRNHREWPFARGESAQQRLDLPSRLSMINQTPLLEAVSFSVTCNLHTSPHGREMKSAPHIRSIKLQRRRNNPWNQPGTISHAFQVI